MVAEEFKAKLMQEMQSFMQHKVPMMAYAGVEIAEVDAEHSVIKIPLQKETKNHLDSMYFGALAVGADAAGGMIALYHIMLSGQNISLVFKDFSAQFLRRPEADVCFSCYDGKAIKQAVEQALASGERVNLPLTIKATTPETSGDEVVATFTLTLSLKKSKS